MRVVLDVNVLISGILSAGGAPARILGAWQAGRFDLVVSPALLAELGRVLGYRKIRRRISSDDAAAFVDWLSRSADLVRDPDMPAAIRPSDAGDDYLIALAADQRALLVSGDRHLLDLAVRLPIQDPATFLMSLDDTGDRGVIRGAPRSRTIRSLGIGKKDGSKSNRWTSDELYNKAKDKR